MQHRCRFLSLLLGMAAMLTLYGPAVSQETPRSESTDTTSVFSEVIILEELVVIGSRAKPRSVVESAVPVDVVSSAEIAKQGEADLQNLVRTVVPSFNIKHPTHQRCLHPCPAGQSARSGTRPYAGTHQRQTPPSQLSRRLAWQWRIRWRARGRHIGHSCDCPETSGSPARWCLRTIRF